MLFTKSIFTVISLVAAATSTLAAPSRLTKRDFFCDVKNVHCCDELLSNKEAGEALGGILNIPASIIGNVGLGCSVRLHSSHFNLTGSFPVFLAL